MRADNDEALGEGGGQGRVMGWDNDESWAVIKAISCPALSLYNGPAMDGLGGAGGAGYTPIHNKSPTLFYIGPGA